MKRLDKFSIYLVFIYYLSITVFIKCDTKINLTSAFYKGLSEGSVEEDDTLNLLPMRR